ncbi:MAG: hydroxymethylglutaryl-CoA lyase [Pseudomonadota bacterium]
MSASYPRRVLLREVGVREGFQFESNVAPTRKKVALLNALAETGLTQIEAASFVSRTRVPGWSDAEAVANALNTKPDVHFLAFYMNDRGLQRARAANMLTIRGNLYATASPDFLYRNTGWTPEIELARATAMAASLAGNGISVSELTVMAAFGCNYSGEVTAATVIAKIDQLLAVCHDQGHGDNQVFCLADTMAWATPASMRQVIGAVRERWPTHRIALHLHDTRGLAIANAMVGLQMGVDCFDAAVAGLGGCPFAGHKGAAGNMCTEDFAFLCEELGVDTGIDVDQLGAVGRMAEEIVGHALPGRVKHGQSLSSYRNG